MLLELARNLASPFRQRCTVMLPEVKPEASRFSASAIDLTLLYKVICFDWHLKGSVKVDTMPSGWIIVMLYQHLGLSHRAV